MGSFEILLPAWLGVSVLLDSYQFPTSESLTVYISHSELSSPRN